MIPAMYLILEFFSSGLQVFDPLGLVMLDPLMIHTMALMSFMDETTFPYPIGWEQDGKTVANIRKGLGGKEKLKYSGQKTVGGLVKIHDFWSFWRWGEQ